MSNKFLRFLVLLLQILAIAVEIAIYVYGIMVVEKVSDSYHFIAAVARVAVILLITISYYKTSVTKYNPGNIFVISCLFFLSLSELGILSYFVNMTGWSLIPPRALVRTVMFSQYMAYFSLIGYAIQYQTNEHSSVVRLLALGITAVAFLTVLIPASQNVDELWSMPAPMVLVVLFACTATVTHLILAFSEPTRVGTMRHVATILMIIGNFVTIKFGQIYPYTIIGSGLFIVGGLITVVITLRNSVIL